MPNNLVLYFLCFISIHAISQVGINTLSPADGSILDIESTDKGLLIPRINIQNLQVITPITGGATESLLGYNTNATTGEGFYFWKDNRWNLIYSYDSDARGLQFYAYSFPVPIPDFGPDIDLSTIRNRQTQASGTIAASGHTILPLSINFGSDIAYNGVVIKYVGTYTVKNSGTFIIDSHTNDGTRIYIDDVCVLDSWINGGNVYGSTSVFLTKGKHKFEFWVYNHTQTMFFHFTWGSNPDGNTGIIEATQFTIE